MQLKEKLQLKEINAVGKTMNVTDPLTSECLIPIEFLRPIYETTKLTKIHVSMSDVTSDRPGILDVRIFMAKCNSQDELKRQLPAINTGQGVSVPIETGPKTIASNDISLLLTDQDRIGIVIGANCTISGAINVDFDQQRIVGGLA